MPHEGTAFGQADVVTWVPRRSRESWSVAAAEPVFRD